MQIRIVLFFLLGLFISCTNVESEVAENEGISNEQEGKQGLPSWKDSDSKRAIVEFVENAADPNSQDFIPIPDRIATFDNDGTLWSEQPAYFQLLFVLDQVNEMAADHPEWKEEQPFKAALENDMHALHEQGMGGLMTLLMATHAGMTNEEFETAVESWLNTAKHPTMSKPYTELIYQPMLELITYLEENDFKVFIVSGGGIDFMRVWVEDVYGIPKDQVIGSTIKKEYSFDNGVALINRLPEIDHIDDKEGKPESIDKYIGRKPVFCGGNSDGDLEMMRYTDSNSYPSFKLYVHHTDSIREWAYDRESSIGRFDKALDEAREKGWTIASMASDWKVVYSE